MASQQSLGAPSAREHCEMPPNMMSRYVIVRLTHKTSQRLRVSRAMCAAPDPIGHSQRRRITSVHGLSGSRFSTTIVALIALSGLSIGILRLGVRTTPIQVVAYLTSLLVSMIFAAIVIYRLMHNEIVERFLLSIAIGAVPPACGAWLLGSASAPKWIPIRAGMASKGLFVALAGIAFTLTVALMTEMRFAGSLPRRFEQERRKVFRSFYLGGGLTTSCAIAGVCLVENPGTRGAFRPSSNLVEALLGASIYGTIVIGILIVILAAVPREGFKAIAASEEEQLYAAGYPSRSRNAPTRRYVRQMLPSTALAVAIIASAVFVWWMATFGLLVSAAWLLYARMSRELTPRADEGLPLHPVTFIATVLAGVCLPFAAHAILPSLEPAPTQTVTRLYEIAVVVLGVGYVAFAAGHPPEPRTGLLPSLHTVGIWCGVAALAGLGIASSILGVEQSGGWFPFWITVTATPAMLWQILLLRSSSVRA